MRMTVACVLLLAPLSLALAKEKAPASPALPPEVNKTVQAFSGTWMFEGTMTGGPGSAGPMKLKETAQCRKAAGGRVVLCTGKGTPGPYSDVTLIAYDVNGKAVRFVGMDSSGSVHDHTCQWKDGKTLACDPLTVAGEGGQPVKVDLTVTFADAKNCAFVEATTLQDGTKLVVDVKGKRK